MAPSLVRQENCYIQSVGETLNRISCIAWLDFRGVELLDMDAHIRPYIEALDAA